MMFLILRYYKWVHLHPFEGAEHSCLLSPCPRTPVGRRLWLIQGHQPRAGDHLDHRETQQGAPARTSHPLCL